MNPNISTFEPVVSLKLSAPPREYFVPSCIIISKTPAKSFPWVPPNCVVDCGCLKLTLAIPTLERFLILLVLWVADFCVPK